VCTAAAFVHPRAVERFFATRHRLIRRHQENIFSKECSTPCNITLVKRLVVRSVKSSRIFFISMVFFLPVEATV
jgi:hypothetical protein